MIKFNQAFSAVVVPSLYSSFAYGPPMDSNLSISAILPDNGDFGLSTTFFDQIASLFELQSSRLWNNNQKLRIRYSSYNSLPVYSKFRNLPSSFRIVISMMQVFPSLTASQSAPGMRVSFKKNSSSGSHWLSSTIATPT